MRKPLDVVNIAILVIGVMAIAILGPWLFRELRTLPHPKALAARADQRIVTLEVGGMTCGGCAATVQSKLTQVPGVSNVDVRFPQRRAYVVCDKAVPDTALTGAVHRAGPGFLAAIAAR